LELADFWLTFFSTSALLIFFKAAAPSTIGFSGSSFIYFIFSATSVGFNGNYNGDESSTFVFGIAFLDFSFHVSGK